MVNLYIKSILKGRITYSKVPAVYKEEVKRGLEKRAESGEITAEELEKYLNE